MLAESFSRYIREFRRPCEKKRTDIINKLNMKLDYAQIQPKVPQNSHLRKINHSLKQLNSTFTNAPMLRKSESKQAVTEK